MTGYEHFNFESFDDAKKRLNKAGFEVFSPADHDRFLLGKDEDWMPSIKDTEGPWLRWDVPEAPTLRDMLGADLAWICQNATHLFMLRGWERSKGAIAEHATATALGLTIHYET